MTTADFTVQINRAAFKEIRRALIHGLYSFGEIERLIDVSETMKYTKQDVPPELIPRHPTGLNDTIADFAAAFHWLESAE